MGCAKRTKIDAGSSEERGSLVPPFRTAMYTIVSCLSRHYMHVSDHPDRGCVSHCTVSLPAERKVLFYIHGGMWQALEYVSQQLSLVIVGETGSDGE